MLPSILCLTNPKFLGFKSMLYSNNKQYYTNASQMYLETKYYVLTNLMKRLLETCLKTFVKLIIYLGKKYL